MSPLRANAVVLTLAIACSSPPNGHKPEPAEPLAPVVMPVAPAPVLAPAPPPPRLACEPGTALVRARAPEPAWHCVRSDGVRHGPFQTTFPDDTVEISGSYREGALDGAWVRHAATGGIVEEGTYVAGHKDGAWTQRTAIGSLLGTYTMSAGTGTAKVWYANGALYSEQALVKSVPHGAARTYAPDGTFVAVARYVHGKLDGSKVFGSRQTMRFEETFAHGVRRDKRIIWVQGTLIAEENYDRAGKLDGAYTLWRRAKVPRMQGTYAHGKRDGLWQWFDRGNNKEREGAYAHGQRSGLWREWWERRLVFSGPYTAGKPDGDLVYFDRASRELGRSTIKAGTGTLLTFHANKKPSSRTALVDGERAGVYQELTPLGKVVVDGRYRNDVRHGAWKQQTPEGVPQIEQAWKRGRLDGSVKKYIDGALAMEATYSDGKATGAYVEYRAGKPALTGQFVDDRKDGTWTRYAADGQVLLVATYKAGVLDGPWQQLDAGVTLAGTMTAGRRSGTWTRTDQDGTVAQLTYPTL